MGIAQGFNKVIDDAILTALKNEIDEKAKKIIEKAKDEIEREISNSLASIATSIQRHFLVHEFEERIIIEIRGKL